MKNIEKCTMDAVYRRIKCSVDEPTLVIAAVIIRTMLILFIIESRAGSEPEEQKLFQKFLVQIHQKLVEISNTTLNSIWCIYLIVFVILGIQIYFSYLVMKKTLLKYETKTIQILSYSKNILDLPALTFLLYVLKLDGRPQLIFSKIISALLLTFIVITGYIFDSLNFTCLLKQTKKSIGNYEQMSAKFRLGVQVILVYIAAREKLIMAESIIAEALLVIIHLCLIYSFIKTKIKKLNPLFQSVDWLTTLFIACYYLTSVFQLFLPLLRENNTLFFTSIFIWSSLALHNFLAYMQFGLLTKEIDEINTEEDVIAYIRLLFKLYHERHKTGNYQRLLGLIKNHVYKCTNVQCPCRSWKQSDLAFSNNITICNFAQVFMEMVFQNFQKKFKNISSVWITCLAYEVQIHNKYPLYFYLINSLINNSKTQISVFQNFSLLQIKDEALRQVKQKNERISAQNCHCKDLIKIQKNISQSYVKMQKLGSKLAFFFKNNSRNHCKLQILRDQLKAIYNMLIDIRQFFDTKQNSNKTLSMQFTLLMLCFFRNLFNLPFEAKQLMQQLQIIYRRHNSKVINHEYFNFAIFGEHGCVIQSCLDNSNFGFINRITAKGASIFGYPSTQSMLNLSVNELLPKCNREEHQKMIQSWVLNGSFKNINKMQETFCYTSQQRLFKVLMRAQVATIQGNVMILIGLIKINQQNFLMINKDGKIDSFGLEFDKFFNNDFRFKNVTQVFSKWQLISQQISHQRAFFSTTLISNKSVPVNKFQNSYNSDPKKHKQINIHIEAYKCSLNNQEFSIVRLVSFDQFKRSDSIIEQTKINNRKNHKRNSQISQVQISDQQLIPLDKKSKIQEGIRYDLNSISSSNNENVFRVRKMIEEINERAAAKEQVKYPLLQYTTAALSLLFVLALTAVGCQLFVQVRGLASFNEVIYADSAVSDNMQLLEILYNNIMMFDQHCSGNVTSADCLALSRSASDTEDILTELLALDVQDVVRNVTFFGHRYFVYEVAEVNMTLNGTRVAVGTFQFMEYFVRHCKALFRQMQRGEVGSEEYREIVANMKANWHEMKRINTGNIQFYEAVGIAELDQCALSLFLTSGCFALLVTLYSLVHFCFHRLSERFLNKVLTLFRRIPTKVSETLSTYFDKSSQLLKHSKISLLQKNQMPTLRQAFILCEHSFTAYKSLKQYIIIGLIWLIIISMSAFLASKTNEFTSLEKNTIIKIDDLMQSENNMLQNYFELKAMYLFEKVSPKILNTYISNMMNTLNMKQNQFVKSALDSSLIVANEDLQQGNQFSKILIQNVCQMAKNVTTPEQYNICVNSMKYRLLEEGILISMTFFQNLILETAFQALNQVENTSEVLSRDIFYDLDRYMIYMFRMYQLTQAKTIEGLTIIMTNKIYDLVLILIVETLILSASLAWWCWKTKQRRLYFSQIYGYLLAFPTNLVEQSKSLQQNISRLL